MSLSDNFDGSEGMMNFMATSDGSSLYPLNITGSLLSQLPTPGSKIRITGLVGYHMHSGTKAVAIS